MKCYEMVREIFNECQNNQMRDVFFDEIETDSVDETVAKLYAGEPDLTVERSVLKDGSIVFEINSSDLRQKITFTEI